MILKFRALPVTKTEGPYYLEEGVSNLQAGPFILFKGLLSPDDQVGTETANQLLDITVLLAARTVSVQIFKAPKKVLLVSMLSRLSM